MNSRRKFIFDCSAVVAALTVAPVGSFSRAAGLGARHTSLDQMDYSMLAGQVNTLFFVRLASGQRVGLKLLKAPLGQPTPVRLGKPLPGDAGFEKFSLIFSGPKDAMLASAIHRFEHEQLGRFEMFIGQVGQPHPNDVRYEAGFNRPPPAAVSFAALT